MYRERLDMTPYEKELQTFRHDQVQRTKKVEVGEGYIYDFIPTSGHGYLVVPTGDKYHAIAKKIAGYGYIGKHALYLEEDCEYRQFEDEVVLSQMILDERRIGNGY
jgi:hypothetical protein